MENVSVTFRNKDNQKQIRIDLQYNPETSNIDYDVDLGTDYTTESEMDFVGFLADMFLNSLKNGE